MGLAYARGRASTPEPPRTVSTICDLEGVADRHDPAAPEGRRINRRRRPCASYSFCIHHSPFVLFIPHVNSANVRHLTTPPPVPHPRPERSVAPPPRERKPAHYRTFNQT